MTKIIKPRNLMSIIWFRALARISLGLRREMLNIGFVKDVLRVLLSN